MEDFDVLRRRIEADLSQATSLPEVEDIRVRYLGRKGSVTTLAKSTDFSQLSAEEKKSFGARFNELKDFAQAEISAALEAHREASLEGQSRPDIDMTLPGTHHNLGCLHPITLVQMELERIFEGMGYTVLAGFEAEEEYYNFDALNIPADHPARDMQDTYWLTNGMLLRTHTSANQVRALERFGAPLRAVFPGRCFRYESIDPSHENTFYQLEGLLVDESISVANLIAVMKALLREVFHRDVQIRLRPGYFPFVEPGFELDLQCLLCDGDGCATCKKSGWIELIPCGLVHPRVLEHGGVDTDVYSGFAFGLGLTRLAMMKYGIPDIRLFNSGDIRFYRQFPAAV